MKSSKEALSRRDFMGGLAVMIGAGFAAPLLPGCSDGFRAFGDEIAAAHHGQSVWELTESRFGSIYWVTSRGGRLIVQLGAAGAPGDYEFAVNGVVLTGLDDATNSQAAERIRLRVGDQVQWFVRPS